MSGSGAISIEERRRQRAVRIDRWQLRQRHRPLDNRPVSRPYGAPMPSAVDRVRFGRFVDRVLRSARERGLTDTQIEQATGIRASTFHRWKRGEVAPTVDKVRQFCAGLGVSPREALAALGVSDREPAEPEPIIDPDILALLRKLQDPNTNQETKDYIRATMQLLANMPARPKRRKAS